MADKDDAGPKELAGFGQLGGNTSSVQRGRTLIGMLKADPVQKQPIAVNNVKEVSHSEPIRPGCGQFPVTNV